MRGWELSTFPLVWANHDHTLPGVTRTSHYTYTLGSGHLFVTWHYYQDADLMVTMSLLTIPALFKEPTKLVLKSPDSSLFVCILLLAIVEAIKIWRYLWLHDMICCPLSPEVCTDLASLPPIACCLFSCLHVSVHPAMWITRHPHDTRVLCNP